MNYSSTVLLLTTCTILWVLCTVATGTNCVSEIKDCGDNTVLQLNNLAEYALDSDSSTPQSVCLLSNSTNYTQSSNVAIRVTNYTEGQFYSCVSLEPALACSSSNSSAFNNSLVLFISLQELSNSGNETIEFNVTSANGSVQFSLNHRPRGIYPIADSSVTVSPGDSVPLNWLAYDIDSFVYTYTASNGNTAPGTPGTFNVVSGSPPCVAPALTNPNETFTVPLLATVSIATILIEEGGAYVVSGNNGSFNSTIQVTVNVTGPPFLEVDSEGVVPLQINQAGKVMCKISHTNTRPSWYFENIPIENNSANYNIKQRQLIIINMTIALGGWYTCVASNEIGTTYRDFLVLPIDTPQVLDTNLLPGNIQFQILSGSTLVLPCYSTGLPTPSIQWSEFTNDSSNVMIDPISGALVIKDYTIIDSTFDCNATNTAGFDVGTISNITLNSSMSINVSTETVLYNLLVGENITLDCLTEGTWYKNGNQLVANVIFYEVTGNSDGSNGGFYCCVTDSNVYCFIVNVILPANVTNKLMSASVQAGRGIGYFLATKTPNNLFQPVLSWSYNSELLRNTVDQISVDQNVQGLSSLFIKDSQYNNRGIYSVKGCSSFINSSNISANVEIQVVAGTDPENNLLMSSDAEGTDTFQVLTNWGVTNDDANAQVTSMRAEKHFTLVPDSNVANPSMRQSINRTGVGEKIASLSCRMRSSSPSQLLPQVNLTASSSSTIINSTVISLPYDNLHSWQWVAMDMQFTANGNYTLSVTMETMNLTVVEDPTGSSLFFDDLYLSVVAPTSVTINTTSSTTTPTTQYTDEINNAVFLAIAVGSAGGAIIYAFVIAFCFCCCLGITRRRKSRRGQTKSPLINDLERTLNVNHSNKYEKSGITLKSTRVIDEDQPVYILPGETPIYDESSPVINKNIKRLTVSYDYPGVVTSPPKDSDKNDKSYDYARSPVGSVQNHSPLQTSPISITPLIHTEEENHTSASLSKPVEPSLVIPIGSVKRISGIFESKEDTKQRDLDDDDNYEICNITEVVKSEHPSSPFPTNQSRSQLSDGGVAIRKTTPILRESPVDLGNVDNEYESFTIDPEKLPRTFSNPPSLSPHISTMSPKLRHHASSSITNMPLPSLPTEANKKHDTTSGNGSVSVQDPPVDSDGYLSLVNKSNKTDDENPYYRTISNTDENQYDNPLQKLPPSPNPQSDSDGYSSMINKQDVNPNYKIVEDTYDNPNNGSKEESPYANPDLESTYDDPIILLDNVQNKNQLPIQDESVYTSITSAMLPSATSLHYDYCSVTTNKSKTIEDGTYVVSSLDEDTSIETGGKPNLSTSSKDEDIYY